MFCYTFMYIRIHAHALQGNSSYKNQGHFNCMIHSFAPIYIYIYHYILHAWCMYSDVHECVAQHQLPSDIMSTGM